MLEARDLAKSYGKNKVLKNISFHIPQKSILAVAGANGAGKTTLLKMLSLILRPDAGRVLILGQDAFEAPEKFRSLIGYVPQTNAFFHELTVRENLDYWRGGKSGFDEAVLLGLEAVLGKKASSLSGGMQRRLNLALGIMNGPSLLVMDEPLTGVDIRTRRQLLEWMAALRGMGLTVVYSTHHTDEIEGTADELLVLRDGLVTFFGPVGAEGGVAGLLAECS